MTSPAPLPNSLGVSSEQPPDHRTLVNQANAARSTGPRTAEGKAASSQNSLVHGLSGRNFKVLPDEDQEAFDELHAAFLQQFDPQQPFEQLLVRELAQHSWLSQRALNMQSLCFGEDGQLNDRRLSLALRYLNTHRRIYDQIFQQLTEIQESRALENGFVSQAPTEAQIHAMFAMPPMPSLPAAPQQKPLTRRELRRNNRKNRR